MGRFAAKLTLALHYHWTRRIVPCGGGVAIRWYSNFDAFTGELPNDLLQVIGPPDTLKQGKFQSGDQFMFAYASTEDARMSVHYATFRGSFAVIGFAAEDVADLSGASERQVFQPGFLKDQRG
jgi:hypothetical protein